MNVTYLMQIINNMEITLTYNILIRILYVIVRLLPNNKHARIFHLHLNMLFPAKSFLFLFYNKIKKFNHHDPIPNCLLPRQASYVYIRIVFGSKIDTFFSEKLLVVCHKSVTQYMKLL